MHHAPVRAVKKTAGTDTSMPTVLILSSLVASSAVGGSVQAATFAREGIEAVFAPTVLFGRHPGLGAPGGGPVDAAIFAQMLEGVAANGVFEHLDAVVAGYFASAEQVAAAARTIDAVRAVNSGVRIIVDPIMGDRGVGLYVGAAVAEALAADLVTRADLIAPNAWELERLTGLSVSDPGSALAAARASGGRVLVSSVDVGADIGVVYADDREAWLAVHRRADYAPNGTGDLLIALFASALLRGMPTVEALDFAVDRIVRQFAGGVTRIERLA